MRILNFLFFSLLLFSISFALEFSLTTNVDAEVSFGSTKIQTKGGEEKDVTVSGITSQSSVEISVKSLNPRYEDSTFTTTLDKYSIGLPAWEAGKQYCASDRVSYNGKIWESRQCNTGEAPKSVTNFWESSWKEVNEDLPVAVVINLYAKELPTDSAFIPIYSEVDAEVDVSSNIFNGKFEIKGKRLDTLILPLTGDFVSIQGKSAAKKVAPAKLISKHGYHLLSLSQNDYKNAEMRLIGINGRVISTDKLSGINQTSITVSGVAAGIYVLNIKGVKGANFTSKIMHNGGDLRFAASFSGDFEVGGLLNSKTIRTAATRASGVQYKITITPTGGNLGSKTMNIEAVGGLNEENIYASFIPEKFSELLNKSQYEAIFPNRYGFGRQDCANATANADPNCSKGKFNSPTGNDGDYDYYSYESFLKAIDLMGEIEVDYEFGKWSGLFKMTWKNKRTGDVKVITHPKFYENGGMDSRVQIDYADYCNKGDLNTRKRELAASLAHMTQETGGYGTSGDQHFHWGLYWREEAGNPGPYASPDPLGYYNAVPGKSYHGRGPKQLTHPYNYGPFSEFLYGDKDILLNNPDLLCPPKPQDATIAFASAIWFWMTPQPPKPSSHNVMIGNTSDVDIGGKPDRSKSAFGWTISIINGGYECGAVGDARANNRIQHYKRYLQILGSSDPDADFGCYDMN